MTGVTNGWRPDWAGSAVGAPGRLLTDKERAAFARVRRLRRWLIVTFLAYLPVAVLSGVLSKHLMIWVAVSVGVLFVVNSFRHSWSRCPLCQQRCFQRGLWHNPWAGQCLHCGAELYPHPAPGGPAPQAAEVDPHG